MRTIDQICHRVRWDPRFGPARFVPGVRRREGPPERIPLTSFEVAAEGAVHVPASAERAAPQLAPVCTDCRSHTPDCGLQAEGQFFRCAHCAYRQRFAQLVDHT
ncbi:DUF504 domain-containing protein [Streptomyces sp. NPDC005969]|uniref:DUF504 domain-containing protein n=1 Tax=Streptomyces sp. NPDC005969 TaxID=3156722 RepID=UPI00340AC1F5